MSSSSQQKAQWKKAYMIGTQDKHKFFENVVEKYRCEKDILYDFFYNGDTTFRTECLFGLKKYMEELYGQYTSKDKLNSEQLLLINHICSPEFKHRSIQDAVYLFALYNEPGLSIWILSTNRLNRPIDFEYWRDHIAAPVFDNYIYCRYMQNSRINEIADLLRSEYFQTCGLPEPPQDAYQKEYDKIQENNGVIKTLSSENRSKMISKSSYIIKMKAEENNFYSKLGDIQNHFDDDDDDNN
jgi:hypothetical protein